MRLGHGRLFLLRDVYDGKLCSPSICTHGVSGGVFAWPIPLSNMFLKRNLVHLPFLHCQGHSVFCLELISWINRPFVVGSMKDFSSSLPSIMPAARTCRVREQVWWSRDQAFVICYTPVITPECLVSAFPQTWIRFHQWSSVANDRHNYRELVYKCRIRRFQ